MEKSANDRWFVPADRAGREETVSPTRFVISALCVQTRGGHDHLRIWSRGGVAGELVLEAGDVEYFVTALGLVPGYGPIANQEKRP